MIDLDLQDFSSHDRWSDRDRLPRDPQHKKQRLKIFASHLPDGSAEFDCTVFRVDPKGALVLTDRAELVTAFSAGSWQSFEAVELPEDDTDDA